MVTLTREPYRGPARKLVLAFDVGTTYSGISYSVLDPGLVPEIKGVTRFPAQDRVGGDAKIPSIIFYDKDGRIKAIGAEALADDEWVDDEEDFFKAEWFKMHMRPKSASSTHVSQAIPPLPPNKTVMDVFADFLRYLFQCAKIYIIQSDPNGERFWATLEKDIDFVLTHPNGWGGAEQGNMRKACVMAGLIPATDEGRARVRFVSEGEASLHFCIHNGLSTTISEGVIILDAGGGTLDVSSYTANTEKSFQEIAAAQCFFKGSIFVTREARVYLQKRLQGSRFQNDLDIIVKTFDQSAKLRCRNATDPLFIKFGGARDKDLTLDIRSGQMRLSGDVAAGFFEPSLQAMLQAIDEQISSAVAPISSVFLVGGFGASDLVFNRLKAAMEVKGLRFCRPDSHVNKAVADGGVSFYLDHFVTSRVAKFTYGIRINTPYDSSVLEHRQRAASIHIDVDGSQLVPNYFQPILHKETQVSETTEFRRAFCLRSLHRSDVTAPSFNILSYQGANACPNWTDITDDPLSVLCVVTADTSMCSFSPQPNGNGQRGHHYRLDFEIVLLFGLTELRAQIVWKEKGVEKRGPARVVYDGPMLQLA